jgi:glycine cleavage system H protein
MNLPKELMYTKSHEWAKIEGSTVTVGISDYAQHEISDVVYVELPTMGQTVQQGKTAGVVESVKAAFNIYAPMSGKITAINNDLTTDPALVNQDPYGRGWFFKIEASNLDEKKNLMATDVYESHLKSGAH